MSLSDITIVVGMSLCNVAKVVANIDCIFAGLKSSKVGKRKLEEKNEKAKKQKLWFEFQLNVFPFSKTNLQHIQTISTSYTNSTLSLLSYRYSYV